nr:phage minor capsid protein [uncultured Schaedlerella sp.]
MNREYKEKLSKKIEQNYVDLEARIMQDIIRRIKKAGKITSTADYQINRLLILGYSSEDIEKMIKDALNASYPDIFELYDQVIDWEYVRNKDVYEQVNQKFIPLEENGELQQAVETLIRQTGSELENITGSLGFYLDYGNGRRVVTPLAEIYQKYLDEACMDIVSGAFDYNSTLRRVVTQLTNSGLRQIDYASGHMNRVDVAARRAVMTGITQLTGHIADMNAAKLGTDFFEVAWHAGARPTHQVWQGKVYSRDELYSICGLGTVTGLEGVNCYHERYPFIPGVSERNWSDEWLEEQNRKENTPKQFKGKEYTTYEAKQRQRQMETAMRAQREQVELLKTGGADYDVVTLARCKYQAQLDEYAKFSDKMGLVQERERIYLDMRGRVAPADKSAMSLFPREMIENANRDIKQYETFKKVLGNDTGSLANFGQIKYTDSKKWEYLKDLKEYLEKYPTSDKRYYDAGEKLKELGIKKGLLLPPVQKQAFIVPEGKRDPYHIMNRMLERNITDDDVRSYMQNAKAMFLQWGGQRQLFVSEGGMCLVLKQNDEWIYKTVWSKHEFDEDSEKIMEVLKNAGL